MAGSSRTDMSTFYPAELSGSIASQWGEDVNVTMDDKLHMSEQTNIQTVQGPINFSKTSTFTFAGPFNNTTTSVNTFAGSINNTSTSMNTFAGPMDFNNTGNFQGAVTFQTHAYFANGTTYYVDNLGNVNFNAATFSGAIDANSTLNVQGVATFQTNIQLGGNFINTATFSGAIDANSTNNFAGVTTFQTTVYFANGTTYYVNNSGYVKFGRYNQKYSIPLYPNIRIGDWSWVSTDEYIEETAHGSPTTEYFAYLYPTITDTAYQVSVDYYISATSGGSEPDSTAIQLYVYVQYLTDGGTWTTLDSDFALVTANWTDTFNEENGVLTVTFTPAVDNSRQYRIVFKKLIGSELGNGGTASVARVYSCVISH